MKAIGIMIICGICLGIGSYIPPLGFLLLYLFGILDM